MYKYNKIIAFFAMIGWLVFVFSAFKGFHFWYTGFVFFLWLSLASLNYRHESSLWYLKNKVKVFFHFYLFLVLLAFVADFIIGQKLTHLWIYPYYNSVADWARLYLIIYPFGGLSLIELVHFFSSLFGEKFVIVHRRPSAPQKLVDNLDLLLDIVLVVLVTISPVFIIVRFPGFGTIFVWIFVVWTILTTMRFKYHISHWLHWISIIK